MIIINKDYTIEKINKKGLEILGKKEKDVVGCKCYKILHGIDAPQDFCPYKQTKKTNQAATAERYEKIFDKYFSIKCSPIFNEKGEIVKFVDLMRDVTDQKKVEKKLIKSEERYQSVFENTGTATTIFNDDRLIKRCNSAFENLSGYSKKEIENIMYWDDFITDYDYKKMTTYHEQRSKGYGNPPSEYECDFICKDDKIKKVHVKISIVPQLKERVFSLIDITDRMIYEKKIKESLKEKEILLKEVHHRVKNNLQIVSTMLKLQSDFIDDEKFLDKFKESQNRIQSIALVHERLYKSEDLSEINFDDYLRDFMVDIIHSYKDKKKNIDWSCNCKDISLNVNTGIPCALIINELVSNSLKHGFSEKNQGKIDIELSHEEGKKYILKVKDDGKGLPKNFDLKNCSSLGLQLVDNLANQFNGKIKYFNDNGAVFEIEFKETS